MNALVRLGLEPQTAEFVGTLRSLAEEARSSFRTAVRLNPEFSPARAALGKTFLMQEGGVWEGIAILTQAAEEMPSRADVIADLALLTAVSGNIEGARLILNQKLRRMGDRDLTRFVESALEEQAGRAVQRQGADDYQRGIDFANAGQEDSALAVFKGLAASTDSTVRQSAREAEREVKRVMNEKAAVKRYNQAIDFLNAGELARPRQIFRELLSSDLPPGLKEEVEKALKHVEERMKNR